MMTRPRYNSLKMYLDSRFGEPVRKIALDAGLPCPHRDLHPERMGCTFCNSLGSGTGASGQGVSIAEQVERAIPKLRKRFKADKFIAYFQSNTNTAAPVEELSQLYFEALAFEEIAVLAIGTRPDYMDQEKLDLLVEINNWREVWLELGLQSAHDETLKRINRGHDFRRFALGATRAAQRGLRVWAHLILGLPGENLADVRETIRRITDLGLFGVKLHGLFISEDAPIARDYRAGLVPTLTRAEYVDWVARLIEIMPSEWVLQRLTSDPNPQTLVAPQWMLDKPGILRDIHHRLEELNIYQGGTGPVMTQGNLDIEIF